MSIFFADSGKFCGELSPSKDDDPKMPVFAPAFFSLVGSFDPFLDNSTATFSPPHPVPPAVPQNHKSISTGVSYNIAVYCSKVSKSE